MELVEEFVDFVTFTFTEAFVGLRVETEEFEVWLVVVSRGLGVATTTVFD